MWLLQVDSDHRTPVPSDPENWDNLGEAGDHSAITDVIMGTDVIVGTDVIMGTIASQITSLTIVYSTVYSDADQKKYQRSASLAFVRDIHRWPVNSPHKWPVTRKMFPFDDVIMPPLLLVSQQSGAFTYYIESCLFRIQQKCIYIYISDPSVQSNHIRNYTYYLNIWVEHPQILLSP